MEISMVRYDVHLEMPGFSSDPEALARLSRPFSALHKGRCAHPAKTGYIDVALISGRDGTPAMCMGPVKGGAHAPDEWVDLESLQTYQDGLTALLRQQALP
jgi:acetylornithine deacetylase/succinyl-diaminopimelate desuccinylase-like protein